jgi:hypothetical protein
LNPGRKIWIGWNARRRRAVYLALNSDPNSVSKDAEVVPFAEDARASKHRTQYRIHILVSSNDCGPIGSAGFGDDSVGRLTRKICNDTSIAATRGATVTPRRRAGHPATDAASSASAQASRMRSRIASAAFVSATGRRSPKLRRSPFTVYCRAGNVTLRPPPMLPHGQADQL